MFVSKMRSLTVEYILIFFSDTLFSLRFVFISRRCVLYNGTTLFSLEMKYLCLFFLSIICLLFFSDSAAYFHCRQHLRDAFVRISFDILLPLYKKKISFDISVRLCVVWLAVISTFLSS
uniref:Putative ovule protein n=1 Tax=Solanum chacoense TaxID=4108 RepID=A0A0V0GU79_SOLCH